MNNPVKWIAAGGQDTNPSDLNCLLDLSSNNFWKNYDWFLKHRDVGIRMLSFLITAEFTILGLHYSDKLSFEIVVFALITVSLLAVVLTILAVANCSRSFHATLENAVTVSKILWVKGLTKPVPMDLTSVDVSSAPVPDDITPHVPRYLEDAQKRRSTEEFVSQNKRKRTNTFFITVVSLIVIGGIAFAIGVAGLVMVNPLGFGNLMRFVHVLSTCIHR